MATGQQQQQRGRTHPPPQQAQQQPAQPQRPAMEIRLGRVKAAIWANETEQGVRYGITVCRLYKDQQQKWQTADGFGRDDLLLLAKVADLAHTWIFENGNGQDVPF